MVNQLINPGETTMSSEPKTKDEIIDKLTELFETITDHDEYESHKIVPSQEEVYDELHELDKELEDRFRDDWINYHGYTVAQ